MVCRSNVEKTLSKLEEVGIGGVILVGESSEPVCQVPVDMNKIGLILMGGLNPVACAEEAGIETENRAMSTVMEYRELCKFEDIGKKKW